MPNIISIKDLSIHVGSTVILDDVSLDIPQGKILGVVGGSGSGKTTLGLAILDLLPTAMKITSGKIDTYGKTLKRGQDIGMIFQEPLSAFDPLFTIGAQLDETLGCHTSLNAAQRRDKILSVLSDVEMDDPKRIMRSYPHELSGGLRQRAMIAQAIICGPQLVIADEPTSSLDVTIQAKVIALLKKLNKEHGMTMLFITHDLGLIGYLADTAAVMNRGKIVELAPAADLLNHPKDAYTQALLKAY